MYWDHMNGWGWSMMVVWTLVWVGLLGVVVWAVVQWTGGARAGGPAGPMPPSPEGARDILDRRLASGEIDVDEYRRLREALEPRARAGA